MAHPSKMVDRAEIRQWFEEGRTYAWIQEEYLRKYNLEISKTTIMNWRALLGFPPRQAESLKKIVPWKVDYEKHGNKGWWLHLHAAARIQDGLPVGDEQRSAFETWWKGMQAHDWVADYDPEIGFYPAPRRPGIDKGYIREPDTTDEEVA
jgi:hypothetical protein